MNIVINEVTLIAMDSVKSLLIKTTPRSEKILRTKGFLGLFPKYETLEHQEWTLEFQYISRDIAQVFTQSSTNYNILKENCKSIISQVKQYDHAYVDKAFEEEVLKEK